MAGNDSYERLAWADRFTKPSVQSLRQAMESAVRHRFDAVRKRLLDLEQVEEHLSWYGDCWKWSLEYRTRRNKPPHDPLAVLVPCPEDLQLALPLEKDFTQSLSLKRMRRSVRDGLELAQEPFNTRWSVWSIGGAAAGAMLDDLQDLIELKLKHLAQRAG